MADLATNTLTSNTPVRYEGPVSNHRGLPGRVLNSSDNSGKTEYVVELRKGPFQFSVLTRVSRAELIVTNKNGYSNE